MHHLKHRKLYVYVLQDGEKKEMALLPNTDENFWKLKSEEKAILTVSSKNKQIYTAHSNFPMIESFLVTIYAKNMERYLAIYQIQDFSEMQGKIFLEEQETFYDLAITVSSLNYSGLQYNANLKLRFT